MLQALKGEANAENAYPRDGVVSLSELIGYVRTRVGVEAPAAGWSKSITPQARDLRTNTGEFFFITSEHKVAKLESGGHECQGRFENGMPVVVMGKPAIDTFKDCAYCPEMVVIPAGKYLMGSPSEEAQRYSDEGPLHGVSLPMPIAVGKYEVSFAEWDACVAAGGCSGYRPYDEGWGRGQRPVINVSWEDAKAHVEWLSEAAGQPYRLLSEAE